jgi:invasion protein IalB
LLALTDFLLLDVDRLYFEPAVAARGRPSRRPGVALAAHALLALSATPSFAQTNPPTFTTSEDAAPATANSQLASASSAQLPATITRFDDWELTCRRSRPAAPTTSGEAAASGIASKAAAPAQGESGFCRVSQRLAVKGSGETVFAVNILAAKQPNQQVAIISTPLGGYLVPGMELRIDKAKAARVLYETCNAAGCHGGFALTGRIRDELISGKRMQVRLWTAKSQPVDVDVSLNGLGAAVKAMAEAEK